MSRRRVASRLVACKCGHAWRSAFKNAHWEQCPKCRRNSYRFGKTTLIDTVKK